MDEPDQQNAFDYQDFFEKSPGLHGVMGSDGRFERVSPSWTRLTGFGRDELLGRAVIERIHPEDRASFVAPTEPEEQEAHEGRFLCADGSYRWLSWIMSFDADSQRVYVLARELDVARREAKEASRKLSLYLERSPVAVIESTLEGGIVVWSAAAERVFGYGQEEAIGRRLIDLLAPEEVVPVVRAAIAPLVRGEDPGGRLGVYENMTKDGRRIFCEWHNAPLIGEGGEVRGILSLALDVTQAERERARADESLERYELIMRAAKIGLWDYRPRDPHQPFDKETLVYMSEGIARIIGRSAEETPRKLGDWPKVVHPEDGERVMKLFVEHIQSRREYTYLEYRFVRADGAPVWVGSTWQSQWSANGGLLRFAGAIVDLTEQKLAEEELRDKLALIERQAGAIRELGTPLLEVSQGVLCLPVIGEIDEARGAQMLEATLGAIVERGANFLIIDVTGATSPDMRAAARLSYIARAAALLGAETVITGIRAAVAREVAALGALPVEVKTLRSLKDGLAFCLRARAAQARNVGGPRKGPS